ncbi:MAG TPA: acyl-CoA dehydrogenase family protein [Thermoleophilaceae bacterium]|nr:acyl-CoA dehydrogenase family protein [Thermoleophilaceae bacterium]
MNFDFTDDQQAIKRTASEFLAARFTPERRRELAEAGEYDEGVWKEMSELGWPGIFVPEEHGGQELGTTELAILSEELGYALAPSPFLGNAAAGLLIAHAGSEDQRAKWLPGVASGEATGTVGVVSDGVAPMVPDAAQASFVVLVDGGRASVLEGVSAEPQDTIDSTRRYARVEASDGEPLEGDLRPALDRVSVLVAAELTGVAQRAMEMAVEYAREREQFGRPIGAYQAVAHRCAEMLLETESARATMLFAAYAADHEPESLPLAAATAKSCASDAGWKVTASSLQVHGGIGFTWEHDLHFFLKRAKADAHLYGSAREHRERVADLLPLAG